jgi:voltage-gated potassium channel
MEDFIRNLHQTNNKFNKVQKFIFTIIILSIFSVVLETEISIYTTYAELFYYLNYFFAFFFAVEYFLRLFTCHYRKNFKGIEGKIKYIFSFYSLIDLIAFLPFFIFPEYNELFLLRIFRLIRLLKLANFVNKIEFVRNVFHVLNLKKKEIFFSIAITIFIIFISSILLYLVEGNNQPEAFGSIIRSFWWATITLTTIGYGDVYPITILGKIATIFISISGIGIIAIPTGIIAGAFSQSMSKKRR